jgi:hypothetical protein
MSFFPQVSLIKGVKIENQPLKAIVTAVIISIVELRSKWNCDKITTHPSDKE